MLGFGGIKPSSLFEAKGGASITNTPNNDKPNDVKTTGFGFGSTTGFKAAGEKPNIFGGEKTAKSDLISKNSPGIKFGESNNLSQTTSDKPQATSSLSSFTKPPQGLFGSNTIEKPKDNIFNSSTNIIDKSKSGLFNLPISTDSGGLPPLFGSNNKAGPLPSATSISSMKKKRGAEDDEDSDFNNKRIVNQPIFEAPVKAVESSQKVNQSESGPSLFETKGKLIVYNLKQN
ncbi:hypothetical protein K502DRAFT_86402 [Neoconidiobolus thromboides FSU 785]|nr:hypothetical protein K502DRAFT_86402 [Neoconidiobolus thromboides FSU 785]